MKPVLPLAGENSLTAFRGFNSLLLGLKQLPAYIEIPYSEFFESFKEKDENEKEKLIREAVAFVPLNSEELLGIVSFVADKNGIRYSPVNMKNIPLEELIEIIVSVCMEIGRINIGLVSEYEKKNLAVSQSTLEVST